MAALRTMSNNTLQSLPRKQQGVILIMALVILLAMTTIGVSSISTSTLEERMASNFDDRNISFQAAEAALREMERVIQLTKPDTSKFNGGCNVKPGYCDNSNSTVAIKDYWNNPAIWNNAATHITYQASYTGTQPAKIIVEHMGWTCPSDQLACYDVDPNRPNAASNDPMIYRITALGYGKSANTRTMLQSTYVPQ